MIQRAPDRRLSIAALKPTPRGLPIAGMRYSLSAAPTVGVPPKDRKTASAAG